MTNFIMEQGVWSGQYMHADGQWGRWAMGEMVSAFQEVSYNS